VVGVAVVTQGLKDDSRADFVAVMVGPMGIKPAAGFFGAVKGWFFVGQVGEVDAAAGAGVAEVAGDLEHGGDAAGIVIGAGAAFGGVVVGADQDDVVGFVFTRFGDL